MRLFFKLLKSLATLKGNIGRCPVCERPTVFARTGDWLRDQYLCVLCRSIPRQRAIIAVLKMLRPDYRRLSIHESSPCGPSSEKLRRECEGYTFSQFHEDFPRGEYKDGARCEDLRRMTFPDGSFDLFITQDVLEHVLDPERAFREIHRVLRPGGLHLFTVPCYSREKTVVRARESPAGIEHLAEPEFHANPIDPRGSLVATEWGADLPERIRAATGMITERHLIRDPRRGLDGEFLDIFASRKD